jgi:streptogrisin C
MRSLSVLGSVLLFLLLAAAAPAAAQTETVPGDDPLVQDAAQYAATYEVDLEEALRRLRLQPAIGKLEAELATREPATFAGIWIQHSPVYLVIVQHTPAGAARSRERIQGKNLGELAGVIEQRTVRLSLKRLQAIQAAAHGVAKKQGILADSMINVAENRVELRTTAPGELTKALGTAAHTSKRAADLGLTENVEVVAVEKLSGPQAYVTGGLPVSLCTSGFAVQSGGTLGVTTAAHCGNVQQYNNRSLPLVGEAFSGSSDVQWHTAPELFVTNRIFDGVNDAVTPNYRFITATKNRDQQVVGEFVCKYGITTGQTCGTISTKTYQPGWVPSASPTYIYVTGGSVNLSEGGDSGGPWFSGDTAYGTHSGGYNGAGGVLNDAIYMAIDYIAPLGVSVLTSTPAEPAAGRWTYRQIGDNVDYYTGINATDYECSVAGIAARDADIQENDAGTIIASYLYKQNNHWRIRGEFRTHNNHESWDFDLLCLKRSAYPVTRLEYRNMGDNPSFNTFMSTTAYLCGISGLAAWDGDIQENNTGTIMKSYIYPNGSTWWINAEFRTHNNSESWDLDAMCVERWAPVQRYEFRNLGDGPTFNTFISTANDECGVAGVSIQDGDINEGGSSDIILAYLYKSGGTWWFQGDFRTHNNSENWDVDVFCAQR